MESSILSEVDDTSILRTELPASLWLSSQLATGLSPRAPRSGLERSDFVPWHLAAESASRRVFRCSGRSGPVTGRPDLQPVTRFGHRHCAHQGGSISPLMIFTTCDA